jgi:hypothetical protein
VDKRTAYQLAHLIAAELVGNTEYVEEIVQREELVDDSHDSNLLNEALNELREDLLDYSDTDTELRERYAEAKAQLAQENHAELIRQLRDAPGLFDGETLDG